MKRLYTIVLCSVLSTSSFGQLRYDNNWIFNIYYGEFLDSGTILQFHPQFAATFDKKGTDTYVTNASFSNKNGQLQLYTNGCVINDQNHNLINGGDSINFGTNQWGDCLQRYGYAEGPQAAIFLPRPGKVDSAVTLVHLVGEGVFHPINGLRYYNFEIRSTDLDLKKNKWYTSNKNKIIWKDTFAGKCLVATKHINNDDWWLIIPDESGSNTKNSYNIFRYSAAGFSDFKKQKIGDLLTGAEQCNFSPNGTKYACYNFVETHVSLFDFDRASGKLSNYRKYDLPDTIKRGGCAFSPNSRYLYVSTTDKIWQFDTEATDIANSRELVAAYDGFTDPSYFNKPTYFWQIQQGPDCKLYINSPNTSRYLSSINKPNEKGLACEAKQHSILVRPTINNSMPYFPNYRLGTPYENDCDTITGTSWLEPDLEPNPLVVVPNPADGFIEVKFAASDEVREFSILSTTGETIRKGSIAAHIDRAMIDLSENIPSGIYQILLRERNKIVGAAKFVIIR